MDWESLGYALALVLIFEGLGPFAAPRVWRRAVMSLATQSESSVRLIGALLLLAGVALLGILP